MADFNIHEKYMRMAVGQAMEAFDEGEVPTGCVIVHFPDTIETQAMPRLVGRAHNQVERLRDPTAHAEMIAITQAASALGDWRLGSTVLYVTKEPCAMCAGAIVLARIPTVVFGAEDAKRGGGPTVFNLLDNPRMNHRCEVIPNILGGECRDLLQSFFRARRTEKRGDD